MTAREAQLQTEIEERLAASQPQVELLVCERVAAERLRLTIDHPEGVDLALCEQVTKDLRDLLARYSLEVSSPGPERPLTKPDHFRRYLGARARVRTREPLGRSADRSSIGRAPDPALGSADRSSIGRAPDPALRSADRPSIGPAPDPALLDRRSFTGELVGATDEEVTVAAEGGMVSIRYEEIARSNLTARGGESG